jgi:hypothetical protein
MMPPEYQMAPAIPSPSPTRKVDATVRTNSAALITAPDPNRLFTLRRGSGGYGSGSCHWVVVVVEFRGSSMVSPFQ